MSGASQVGRVLGGAYRLERLIGEGGMGSVYEASHTRLPRRFAIKLLNPEVLGNQDVFERFQREAEIASSLGDEHIVQVFDFNHDEGGAPYMVLELLAGQDLADRLRARGRFTVVDTADVLVQVASALELAHANGIVHRDLKPQNLFVCETRTGEDLIKILDFGISKIIASGHVGTRTGAVMGTPNYMSPEQAQGLQSEIDARTDIFALGAILYELLGGARAFHGDSVIAAVYQVCHAEPPPLPPDVPAAVQQVVARALAKRATDRYQSVLDLRDEFLAAAQLPAVVSRSRRSFPGVALADTGGNRGPATTLSGAAAQSHMTGTAGRRRSLWVAIGVAGLAVGAAAYLLVRRDGRRATTERSAAPVPSTPVPSPSGSPPLQPAPSPAGPGPGPQSPGPAEQVELTLVVTPADATVELDGLVVRDRSLRLPRGGSYKVTISAPGFQPHTRDLGVVADGELRVTLLPELAAVPPPSDRPHRVPRPGKSPGPSASPASTAPASPSPSPAKLPIKGPVVKTL